MAVNLKGIKKKASTKKNRFGAPPALEESGDNLEAPEHAPQSPPKKTKPKTERTEVFSTRISPELLKAFKTQAFMDDMKIVELFEACFKAYQEKQKG